MTTTFTKPRGELVHRLYGVVPVLDQEGLALQEIIEDRNPSSGVTNIQISLDESIDHWMWLWKFVQNTTSFIRAYDHNGK